MQIVKEIIGRNLIRVFQTSVRSLVNRGAQLTVETVEEEMRKHTIEEVPAGWVAKWLKVLKEPSMMLLHYAVEDSEDMLADYLTSSVANPLSWIKGKISGVK